MLFHLRKNGTKDLETSTCLDKTSFEPPTRYFKEMKQIRADFGGGDATKHFSVKKGVFSEKGGGNSVNGGFGKDLYRKGNSVKRSRPFSEPPDSEK